MGAKLKWGILGGVGVVLTILGFGLGFGAFPVIIRDQVEKNLNLFDADSEGRKNFEAPPVDVYMKFYVYHVTNPDQVVSGAEKPSVVEKGPYAYREARSKIHGNFSEESTFVTYGQVKTYHFDKEKSCENCTKDDVVTVINAPMVGMAYILQQDPGLNALAKILNTAVTKGDYSNYHPPDFAKLHDDAWIDNLFMKATVDGLIFNGVVPGIIKFVIDYKLGVFGEDLPIVIQGTNGAQWKVDGKHGDTLINRNFLPWAYDNTAPYVLPDEGKEGFIEHPNGTVLSILSDDTVVLQEKSSPISEEQKWLRGEKDANDWFTFTNPKSGKVLTAYFSTDPRSLTIEDPSNGFAALNTKNGSTLNEWYEVYSGGNGTMDDYLQINRWGPNKETLYDDLTPASWWTKDGGPNGSNACNLLKGSDGQQFPPYVKDTDKLYIFQTDVCRSLFITYEKGIDISGINALRFIAPSLALQANTTANVGFCMEIEPNVPWDTCIQNTTDPDILNLTTCFEDENYSGHCYDGTLDITKCMKNAPVIMSSPHFYQSPEELRLAIDGLSEADPELHGTRLDIEPHTGAAIQLHKRIQFNVPVKKFDGFDAMKNIKDFTLMPLLWVDEGADIDQENIDLLKEMLITPILILEAAKWTLIALGLLLASLGAQFFEFN